MKKGAYIVNNARGAIADVDAVKEAVESGQLGGMHLSFYSVATARSSLSHWSCLVSVCETTEISNKGHSNLSRILQIPLQFCDGKK